MDDGDDVLRGSPPPLRPPLANTSKPRDSEPDGTEVEKLRKWQEERISEDFAANMCLKYATSPKWYIFNFMGQLMCEGTDEILCRLTATWTPQCEFLLLESRAQTKRVRRFFVG